jgi:SAM-dependent methyltransferase
VHQTLTNRERRMSSEALSIPAAYAAARSGAALEYATRLIVASLHEVVPRMSSGTVLDLGCGYSNVLFSEWLLSAQKVIGIDRRHEDVRRNSNLHFRVVGDVEQSPLADSSVDMIVSSFVIEHIADPSALLHECRRVLKPNGTAIFCTPCLFGYKTLIAKFSGESVSNWVWKFFKGRPHPPWPDHYRANTPGRVKNLCAESGLVLDRLVLIPEIPHFFYNSPLLFAFARTWDRFLEVAHLPILHNCMAYVLRRPACTSHAR